MTRTIVLNGTEVSEDQVGVIYDLIYEVEVPVGFNTDDKVSVSTQNGVLTAKQGKRIAEHNGEQWASATVCSACETYVWGWFAETCPQCQKAKKERDMTGWEW